MKYLTISEIGTAHKMQKSHAVPLILTLAAVAGLANSGRTMLGQSSDRAGEPVSGLINPQAVVFNPHTGKAYTVDADAGEVVVANDGNHSTSRVKVGAGPVSIAIVTTNGRAYVANAGDGTVSVIDGSSDAVIATLPVGAHPYSIASDSDTGKVYVSRTYSDQLMVIDAATNSVTGIKTGLPDLLAVNPRSHTVYMLGYEGGDLSALNEANHEQTKFSVGMHAWGMATNPDTGAVYIARPGNAEIAVFDPGSTSPHMIPAGQIPCALAVNPRTNTIFAVNYSSNTVTAIDGAKGRAMAQIATGTRPEAIAVDPEHNLVYVANTEGNSVTVIDGGSYKVLATLNAGNAPYALAIDGTAGKLHVANLDQTAYTTVDVSRVQK